jgi:hypothetical protein
MDKEETWDPYNHEDGYMEHKEQHLSEMSHTHRDFFGFVPPPLLGRTQASTDKKCYNYVEDVHLTTNAYKH